MNCAGGDPPDAARRVVGVPRQPEPPHVHRHAERPRPSARRPRAPPTRGRRRPRSASARISCTDPSVRSVNRAPTTRPPSRSRSVTSALRRSVNVGSVSAASASRSSRSHCGTSAMCWCAPGQPAEVADPDGPGVELHRRAVEAALRQRGEARAEAELVEQGQRGGVHGVAAEVAQEVGVLLQHRDRDAGAGQQQAEHHPGGAATDDEAGRAGTIRHVLNIAASMRRRQPFRRRRSDAGRCAVPRRGESRPAGDLLRAGAVNGLVTLRR